MYISGCVVVVVVVGVTTGEDDGEAWWKKSRLLPQVQPVANLLRALAGDRLPTRPASQD